VFFENLRFGLFERWYQLAGGLQITKAAVIGSGYPKNRIHAGPVICRSIADPCRYMAVENFNRLIDGPRPHKRVIFAGTSQTIGAGARNLEETFFVRTHRQLAATLSPLLLESINISISAVSPPFLLQEYEQKYLRMEPDLLVINLGTNGINEELVTGLSGFLEINRAHHIFTVIVLEPNNSEIQTAIKDKHQIIRSLGARENIPILDLQAYLSDSSVAQSGALWWDFVHLTSYGHSLVAKWLSLQLLPYLKA
jgi:lysophospholipase L1-like esterase